MVGSDELDCPDIHSHPAVNFLNLRGSQRSDVSFVRKLFRISTYYAKLIRYAAIARPRVFHILWNNKFESFDRTLLTLYYKLLGKRIVLTAHNVNTQRRDSMDTRFNRITLGIQYRLADHIFVHTPKMKRELTEEFGVQENRVAVIPFGVNNAVPNTDLTPADAKKRLGISGHDKTILFFGRITPYKGLEHLIAAFRQLLTRRDNYRLVIAGRPDNCDSYWRSIQDAIAEDAHHGRIQVKAGFIPDDETEVYFKAADVVVLPYKDIYQSGVLFLGYGFGLPAIATDVGSFGEDIIEGQTGMLCKPSHPDDLALTIEAYFESNLYRRLDQTREDIREYAHQRHSWDIVGAMTCHIYADLQKESHP